MFFESEDGHYDALLTTSEGGAAWTLLYPEYTIIALPGQRHQVLLVLGLTEHDAKLEDYLNNWIRISRLNGTIDELKDHWIYGRTAVKERPRWSVLRDVLHWVE
jgi:hypothetical protein